jgi:hypothetical protein
MLQAHDVDIVDVEKIGRAAIRVDVFLSQLKPNAGRIVVTTSVSLTGMAMHAVFSVYSSDRLTQICRECGNAALT